MNRKNLRIVATSFALLALGIWLALRAALSAASTNWRNQGLTLIGAPVGPCDAIALTMVQDQAAGASESVTNEADGAGESHPVLDVRGEDIRFIDLPLFELA